MDIASAIILGLVQGVTEFLPVSSSGHLVMIQSLLPTFTQPGILFDVVLHFGTLMAVVWYFRQRLGSYLRLTNLKLVIVGTLPAVIAGLLFRDRIEQLFTNVKLVGLSLIVTGILNIWVDKIITKPQTLRVKNSFLVGLAQAVAIIPGISRSGATIFMGVAQGINRQQAVEFSLILSLPAVLGANFLEMASCDFRGDLASAPYLVGLVVAMVVGYLSIRQVMKYVSQRKFKYFGFYAVLVGLTALIWL